MDRRDVIVIGAGAAGMMCAAQAAARGRSVLLLDHAADPGEKIRISGGGRCNFTNLRAGPDNFLSDNPQFCISALARYTPAHFIALVERYNIAYHEKTLGQLFCDGSAQQIIDMLLTEMKQAGVELRVSTSVTDVEKDHAGFRVHLSKGKPVFCESLVVATGGRSIPKMGASDFGYRMASRFGVAVTETRPALVPLTFDDKILERLRPLSGIAVDVLVKCGEAAFEEAMLFTHRGLSGPAILQISSYWREGKHIDIAMAPGHAVYETLREMRKNNGKQALSTALATLLPKRLAKLIAEEHGIMDGTLGDLTDVRLHKLEESVNFWRIWPSGTEGYRTAEVTLGGVDTRALDSKTMAVKAVPGLYFIGEVVDVTGWLGGYNFQWAWSSGWCAGQAA